MKNFNKCYIMDGPSQSQHLNSDIVIYKLGAKEALIEFKPIT